MFGALAPRYDRANTVLSFGVHHRWRRRAVLASGARAGDKVLDVATGTGDLAFAFARNVRPAAVEACDFAEPMLEVARSKQARHAAKTEGLRVHFRRADALALPYEDGRFDVAAIAFGVPMQFDKCYKEGISKLTQGDIRYAEQLGYRIKLLGITKRTAEGIELRVHPTLIPARRLIANVEGVMNAILVRGDAVGPTLYYGAGAGAEPTGSAVVADLVDVTRLHTADPEHRVPHLAFRPDRMADIKILPMEEVVTSYYLRMRVQDRPGVLADITRILADGSISIGAMIQREPAEGEDQVDIIMLTHETREKNVNAAMKRIEGLPVVTGRVTRIRLEELQ